MERKNLPLGIQDFMDLRTQNFIYVDKTRQIYELVRIPKAFYFLSRPRRFGKSLLLSTLDCLFRGKKELFKGLWLYKNTDWKWEEYPVINIDFNKISHENPELLKKDILDTLDSISISHGLALSDYSIPLKFSSLITSLEKLYGNPVVVLVDEYDKPIISHLGKGEEAVFIADKNRDVLKQFFGVLKAQDVAGSLRFVFLTGVSKFTRVSIFSDLNNLEDLTMRKDFCTLVGYTEQELHENFNDYIEALALKLSMSKEECKEELHTWYNGYQFTAKTDKVYNPFSVLSVLKAKDFKNYWFETGTPSFLLNLIKEKRYNIPDIEALRLTEQSFSTFDIENLRIESLLFQTGYITIKGFDNLLYDLSYPNKEVRRSFIDYLYQSWTEIPDGNTRDQYIMLSGYLKDKDLDRFISTINSILAGIPYTLIANQDENYYHSAFYLMLSASCHSVGTEVLTSRGRIDITINYDDKIYIIELKCNRSADLALNQIKEMGYVGKYKATGKEIIIVGINIDSAKREVSDYLYEVVE